MKRSISQLLLIVLLIFAGKTKAQYVPAYDNNGKPRSSYDRSVEEARNKAIKPYKQETVPTPKTYTPPQSSKPQTAIKTERIKKTYRYKARFSEGLAIVSNNDFYGNSKYGFVNESGEEVIPLIYDWAQPFENGTARVTEGQLHSFLIDRDGNKVTSEYYNTMQYFKEGMSCVLSNGGFGFIDKAGREVVRPQYGWANDFSEGFAAVQLKTAISNYGKGKWGFIDKRVKKFVNLIIVPLEISLMVWHV